MVLRATHRCATNAQVLLTFLLKMLLGVDLGSEFFEVGLERGKLLGEVP